MNNLVRAILDSCKINVRYYSGKLMIRDEFERLLTPSTRPYVIMYVPAYVSFDGVCYLNELHLVEPDGDGEYFTEYYNLPDTDMQAPYSVHFIDDLSRCYESYCSSSDLGKTDDAYVEVVWRKLYQTGKRVRNKIPADPKIGFVWSDADGANYAIVRHDANNNVYKVLTDSAVYASGWHLDVSILPGYPMRSIGTYPWVRI